jgi:hypothetical protein
MENKTSKQFAEKLSNIQVTLNAPKNQVNKFGNYNYRSTEDILSAVKPLLDKHNLILVTSDEIIQIGERYYIKATVRITDGDEYVQVSALAREDKEKKGMDLSQLTGSTSSYARKYALNGLFSIDDTKDSDFTNTHGKESSSCSYSKPKETKSVSEPITDPQLKKIRYMKKQFDLTDDELHLMIMEKFNKELHQINKRQASELIQDLDNYPSRNM